MQVLIENNHFIAIDKPPGLLTQGCENSAEAWAKAYIKEKYQKPGAVFLHAVHRIDQRTSGICLFARTSKGLSRLNTSLREGKWEKTYLANIEGNMDEMEGVLVDHLIHGEGRAERSSKGKRCELHYKVVGEHLLEIDLKTGRYHQIRAQLGLRGHPIVGDVKYGAKKTEAPGIALKQIRLSFPDPITQKRIVIEADREFG